MAPIDRVPGDRTGRTLTVHVPTSGRRAAARIRKRSGLGVAIVAVACAVGFSVGTTASPAAAFTPDPDENPTTASVPIQAAAQTFAVDAGAQQATVAVDAFSATSQSELDQKNAEAAAAQAAADAAAAAQASASTVSVSSSGSGLGAAILALAETYIGVVPYSAGASPSAGFECDGLVQWVYGQNGISLPRGVDSQAAMGTQVSESEAVAGDLVVYPGQHIGIYDGDGGIVDSPDWGRYVSHRAIWGSPIFVHISGV
ncbi:C40 family peptidase [Rathayibacter sp. CAU 1779]